MPLRRDSLSRARRQLTPWSALLWAAAFAVVGSTTPDAPCEGAACQDTWLEGLPALLLIVAVVLIALLPRWATTWAAIGAAATALQLAVEPELFDVPRSVAALLLGLVAIGLVRELDVRRQRQPGARDLAAVELPPLPLRGGAQRVIGVVVLAVCGSALVWCAVIGVHEHNREAHARVAVGHVTFPPSAEDSGSVYVTVDGRTHSVDISGADGISDGDDVEVFVDSNGPFRLTSAPFSVLAGVYSVLVVASVGGGLVARGVLRRRADRLSQAGPRPRLLARVAPSGPGVLLFEPDDVDGARGPVAYVPLVHVQRAEEEPDLVRPPDSWLTRPAYVYGEVAKGSYVVVRTAEDLLVAAAPMRLL